MADLFVSFDPAAADGEKFAPEVAQEIAQVAPSTLNNGSVTTAKLADAAVTNPKVGPGAILSPNIGTSQVKTINLDTGAVTTPKIADDAVTPPKCGPGVMTSQDSAGSALDLTVVRLTAAQYAAIATPSPSVMYLIVGS